MYQPKIIIVPDLVLDPVDWLHEGRNFIVNRDVSYEEEILVAPNHKENFLGVVLLEFREECISQKKKIISYGRANYFTFHALFADEVLIGGGQKPSWYLDDYTGNNTEMGPLKDRENFIDLNKSLKKKVYNYSDNYIANKYWNKPIYIRESSWEIFQKLKEDCPKDVIMCEVKAPGKYMKSLDKVVDRLLKLQVVGLAGTFQKGLLEKIGHDNFLEFQILASWFLNWVFVAIGGSANLFSLIPVKSILLADEYILEEWGMTIRQLAKKRYGDIGDVFPVVVRSKEDREINSALKKCDLEYGFSELSKYPKPEVEMLKVSKLML